MLSLLRGAFVVLYLSLTVPAAAWIGAPTYQPFPDGCATVIMHRFCMGSIPCPLSGSEWQAEMRNAINRWHSAGSAFQFSSRAADAIDNPCMLRRLDVAIIWTDGQTVCPGDPPLSPTGGMAGSTPALIGTSTARVYIYAEPGTPDQVISWLLPVLLTHELGHVLGLGHPDERGQWVDAIMNTTFGPDPTSPHLQQDDINGVRALYPPSTTVPDPEPEPPPNTRRGALENPAPNSNQSGIGVISGWVCDATRIVIDIHRPLDNWSTKQVAVLTPAYGTDRADTQSACGDTDNGFGLTFNWNLLGDGTYTVFLEIDGFRLTDHGATVTVTTFFGEEFVDENMINGADTTYELYGVGRHGATVTIKWEKSLQNFVIVDVEG